MKALLSVYKKDNLLSFAQGLSDLGIELLATEESYLYLKENGISVKEIASYEDEKILDKTVKNINPKLHAGILCKRSDKEKVKLLKELDIDLIDLVCVNLPTFKDFTEKIDDFEEIMDRIDISGPALIRNSAKNFRDVIVITSSEDYPKVLESLKKKDLSFEDKRDLMIKAYEYIASYDANIANYMNDRFNYGFGGKRFLHGKKILTCKYGENPHQNAALYEYNNFFSENFKILKGELTFNNILDIDKALHLMSHFQDKPAVAIFKHQNPCGFALKENAMESYKGALKCDYYASYGGVLVINSLLDEALAKELSSFYFEVILAADISPEALKIIKNKDKIKIISQNSNFFKTKRDNFDFKRLNGGFLFQEADFIKEDELLTMKCVSLENKANKEDLEIAWKLAACTTSNSIVCVKDSCLIALAIGFTSRVNAVKSAIAQAREENIDLHDSTMASEAFLPFKDSIESAAEAGISTIIQAGGSIRDDEVIESANKHGITMFFTEVRHFFH